MIKCLSSKIERHLFFKEEGEELYMRDKQYRKQQEQKKSYKKFMSEMKRDKFKDPLKGKSSKKTLNQIDFNNLTEEELEELEEDLDDEH